MAPSEGQGRKAVVGVALLATALGLILLAGLWHNSESRQTSLITYDRFGIPVPGTDDPARNNAALDASLAAAKNAEEKQLEQRENVMMKTLQDIESQVKLLAHKVTDLAHRPQPAIPVVESAPVPTFVKAKQEHTSVVKPAAQEERHPNVEASKPVVVVVVKDAVKPAAPRAPAIQQQQKVQKRPQEQEKVISAPRLAITSHPDAKREAMGRLLEKAAMATSAESTEIAEAKEKAIPAALSGDTQSSAIADAPADTLRRLRDQIDGILRSRARNPDTFIGGADPAVDAEEAQDNEEDQVRAKAQERVASWLPLHAAQPGSVASEGNLQQAVQKVGEEVRQLEAKEQELLDNLPAAEERVKRARAAVADTEQTLSIARNRLVLARRAAEDSESSVSGSVSPRLLQAEGAALEDEQRVADELQRQQGRLREAEAVAAEAPALARVVARRRKELEALDDRYTRMRLLQQARTLEANKNFAA